MNIRRKPQWLKVPIAGGEQYVRLMKLVREKGLHTICTSGRCPNLCDCWNRGTATLMILGDICTRSCKFCATASGKPLPPNPDEPLHTAQTVKALALKYCVITSVDRDDLPDQGAHHWAETIRAIRELNPDTTIEVLIPDFDAREELIDIVLDARPDVVGHNLETVRRLTPQVRSRAQYAKSLQVIAHIAKRGFVAKSGIMVGLGETPAEVEALMQELVDAGCSYFTIGQYLQPTSKHLEVTEYITPQQFDAWKEIGLRLGFRHMESGPLVRSSYHAEASAGETNGQAEGQMETGAATCQPADSGRGTVQLTTVDWGLIDYAEGWKQQEALFDEVMGERALPVAEHRHNTLVLCEHPHVYTLGRSGQVSNLLIDEPFLARIGATFHRIDRGGDVTYHGPGQLVGYPILNLQDYGLGLRSYIELLEETIIRTLADYGVVAGRSAGATGVWIDVDQPQKARKICAIGVRASRYITMHGFGFNVNSDLTYFNYIHPCGFVDKGVTSLQKETGQPIDMAELKRKVEKHFRELLPKQCSRALVL